jgi:AGZA family xanthine/uracil permease-like MFS transporter
LNFTWYELFIAKFPVSPAARIAVLGVVFATGFEMLKLRGSIIMSIILATLIGINYRNSGSDIKCDSLQSGDCVTDLRVWGQPGGPKFVVDVSDIPSGKLSFKYISKPIFWDCAFTFLFVELFDSFGTLTGLMTRAGFLKGDPSTDVMGMKRVNRAMCVDGFGLWLGAVIGSNSITMFIESNTGVEAGARTGLASIVTGALSYCRWHLSCHLCR